MQGKYDKAREMFERALNIREGALGPVHPDVAASLNDLGWLLRLQVRILATRCQDVMCP